MKKMNRFAVVLALLVAIAALPVMASAQEVSVGADLVSSYVWRGMDCGDGAAIQPYLEFSSGGFALGAWGSYAIGSDGATEADLYGGYGFDFGLYLGLTDYYFPGSDYFEFEDGISSHAVEANVGYEIGSISLSANYILTDESSTTLSAGNDMYLEFGYSFGIASVFIGGGDGWYTTDTDFALCNLGISAEKEIAVTDTFSVPMFGSVILNPDTEQMYIVVGMSF